ncbi:hypothetical protein DN554_28855 [Burkholderia multivorans]|nr:hypothetical protein DN470_29140 [Burkholderia multivorans]RAA22790.1 hypothetical protein DN471_22840 [Burkholderia multivorans]RAA28285.1 hypothetical protein DN465_26240 [Burkholderia multivorans]RAA38587.1 hypothetical protein DN500_24880 [Burkholderia multivorans]RAA44087.1 hypothetical protein DN472_14080 [Burkholderia multivorans]
MRLAPVPYCGCGKCRRCGRRVWRAGSNGGPAPRDAGAVRHASCRRPLESIIGIARRGSSVFSNT